MKLNEALMKAQKEFPAIPRTRTGQVGTRTYKYSDLGDILDVVRPILHANGLMLTHMGRVIDGKQVLVTVLSHISGESQLSDFILPEPGDPQKSGIWRTYFRRYAACEMLGIVTEEDTDGAGAAVDKGRPEKVPDAQDSPPWTDDDFGGPSEGQGYRPPPSSNTSAYVVQVGKFKDKRLSDVPRKDLINYAAYIRRSAAEKGEAPKGKMAELLSKIDAL